MNEVQQAFADAMANKDTGPIRLTITQSLAANALQNGAGVMVPADCDMLLTGIHYKSTGTFAAQTILPNGRTIEDVLIDNDQWAGNKPETAMPVFPPVLYGGGQRIAVNLRDTSTATNNIVIYLEGVRKLRNQ